MHSAKFDQTWQEWFMHKALKGCFMQSSYCYNKHILQNCLSNDCFPVAKIASTIGTRSFQLKTLQNVRSTFKPQAMVFRYLVCARYYNVGLWPYVGVFLKYSYRVKIDLILWSACSKQKYSVQTKNQNKYNIEHSMPTLSGCCAIRTHLIPQLCACVDQITNISKVKYHGVC